MLIYLYNPLYYVRHATWDYYTAPNSDDSDSGAAGVFLEARRRLALLLPSEKNCVKKTTLDPLTVHAELQGLSYKYDIPELKKLSGERFYEVTAHMAGSDPDMSRNPEFFEDFIATIKIIYGSEQTSDHSLRDAIVYLARVFVKTTLSMDLEYHYTCYDDKKARANLDAFQEVLSSFGDFGWDMISLDFDRADFVCDYCQGDFVIRFTTNELGHPDKCACAQRGICGGCASMSELKCEKCQEKGGCRLLDRRSIEKVKTGRQRADNIEQIHN
jgi:hypothetical protein